MAEQNPKHEGIKKLQAEITCPLCLGDFDDPKRLPCEHIYCKVPCLQELLLRSMTSTVTCPECRSVAQIPANDLDSLPSAFHINRLKEVYLSLSKVTVTHASPQGISCPCPTHPSQSQDLYCETCQELICRDCIVVAHQHQEHRYSFVRDVATEQKEAILKELVPVKIITQQAMDALNRIEEVKKEVVSQKEDHIQEISASFDALHHVLEEQKQALLVGLQEQTDQKLATIEKQQQDIEARSSKVQQVIGSVNTAVTHDDDGHEFLSNKHQLAAQITEVTDIFSQVSLDPAVESDFLVARVLPPAELRHTCVSTDYVQKEIPDPQRCSVKGDGLKLAETDTPTTFTVHVANEHGIPCSGKVSVELKTLREGTITQSQVTACSPSQYKFSYTPTVRGRHELSIKVNGEHITDSPFKVFVQISVTKINGPVAEIKDFVGPTGMHLTSDRILVCDYKGDLLAVYDHSLRRIGTVGERSHFLKKLKRPTEVTTDSQSNIYVTTGEGNSLSKFTKGGTHVKTVTGMGRKGGQFNYSNGLRVLEDQFLYVCDSGNSRIVVFDLNLKYLSEISGYLVWPSDLDVDTSGKLYICDHEGGHVIVAAPNGQYLHTISHQLKRPVTVRIFREVLYVSDADKSCVSAFSLSGDYIGSFGQQHLLLPEGLVIDEDGFFYVSNNRQNILVF